MNISFYFLTGKVHQYDVQCIITGGLLFLKGSVYCVAKKETHSSSLRTANGLLFHYINQAPLFLSSLAGQSRHQSTFLRLSMLLHYTFSVLQQSHYQ